MEQQGHLVILVDWEEGTVTPIAAPETEDDAIEAAESAIKGTEPDGDLVAYVLPFTAFRRKTTPE